LCPLSCVDFFFHTTAPTQIYTLSLHDALPISSGKSRLSFGRIRITSEITEESSRVTFGAVHLGDHEVTGGVREFANEQAYKEMRSEEHTSELQSPYDLVCRLLLEKKKKIKQKI